MFNLIFKMNTYEILFMVNILTTVLVLNGAEGSPRKRIDLEESTSASVVLDQSVLAAIEEAVTRALDRISQHPFLSNDAQILQVIENIKKYNRQNFTDDDERGSSNQERISVGLPESSTSSSKPAIIISLDESILKEIELSIERNFGLFLPSVNAERDEVAEKSSPTASQTSPITISKTTEEKNNAVSSSAIFEPVTPSTPGEKEYKYEEEKLQTTSQEHGGPENTPPSGSEQTSEEDEHPPESEEHISDLETDEDRLKNEKLHEKTALPPHQQNKISIDETFTEKGDEESKNVLEQSQIKPSTPDQREESQTGEGKNSLPQKPMSFAEALRSKSSAPTSIRQKDISFNETTRRSKQERTRSVLDHQRVTNSDNISKYPLVIAPKRPNIDVRKELLALGINLSSFVVKSVYLNPSKSTSLEILCDSETSREYIKKMILLSEKLEIKVDNKIFPNEIRIRVPQDATDEEISNAVFANFDEYPSQVQYIPAKGKSKTALLHVSNSLLQKMEANPNICFGRLQTWIDTTIRVDRCDRCQLLGHRGKFCRFEPRSQPSLKEDCIDCTYYNDFIEKARLNSEPRDVKHSTDDEKCPSKVHYIDKWRRMRGDAGGNAGNASREEKAEEPLKLKLVPGGNTNSLDPYLVGNERSGENRSQNGKNTQNLNSTAYKKSFTESLQPQKIEKKKGDSYKKSFAEALQPTPIPRKDAKSSSISGGKMRWADMV